MFGTHTTAQHGNTRAQLQDRTVQTVDQAAQRIIEKIGDRWADLQETERVLQHEIAALLQIEHQETRDSVRDHTTAQHGNTRAQLQDRTVQTVDQAAQRIIEKIGDRWADLQETERVLQHEIAALLQIEHQETRDSVRDHTTAQHGNTRAQLQDRTVQTVDQAAQRIIEKIGDRWADLQETERVLQHEIAALLQIEHQETRDSVRDHTTAQHGNTRAQLQDRTVQTVDQAAQRIIEKIGDRKADLQETERVLKDEIATLLRAEHQAAREHVTDTVETSTGIVVKRLDDGVDKLTERLRPVVSSTLVARVTVIRSSGYETIYALGGFREAQYGLTEDQIDWLKDFGNFLQACSTDKTPTRVRLVGFASAQQYSTQPPQGHGDLCRPHPVDDTSETDAPNCYLANQRVAQVASLLNDPDNFENRDTNEMMNRLNASCSSGRNSPEVALSAGLSVRPWCEVGQMKRARFNAPGEVQPDFLNRSVHLVIQKPGACPNLNESIARGR